MRRSDGGSRSGAADVNRSEVECTVEPLARRCRAGCPVGLGYVKGVARRRGSRAGCRARARRALSRPRRPGLALGRRAGRARAARLGGRLRAARRASAGTAPRRDELWRLGVARGGASGCAERARAYARQLALPLPLPAPPELRPLDSWERIVADYCVDRDHARRAPDRGDAAAARSPVVAHRRARRDARRQPDRASPGMVVARQRPATAKGRRVHAARGRGRGRQRDRAAAGVRALQAGGAHRAVRARRGQARAPRGRHQPARSTGRAPRRADRRPTPRCATSSRPPTASSAATRAIHCGDPGRRAPERELAAVAPRAHSFGRRG